MAGLGDRSAPAWQDPFCDLPASTGLQASTGVTRTPRKITRHGYDVRVADIDAQLTDPMPLSGRHFEADVMLRLRRGEHLVLYGLRGSGKSTLLARMHARLTHAGIPCALSTATAHLEDITRAFAQAYPHVDTTSLPRRKARARLRMAADRNEGVLLLDHVTAINTAMIGFLRRLRGGIAGVLLAVDVERKRDGQHLRHRHLGTFTLPMPAAPPRRLRKLFRDCCGKHRMTPIQPREERAIIRAARGRPGWIVQCIRLIRQERYWHHKTLLVSVLCLDTEIVLRQGLRTFAPEENAAITVRRP